MTRRYLGQRALTAAIRGYQRFVSGRGPLARVTCTFGHTESCSAYGLRAAETLAPSLARAILLILGRLRLCGTASLYGSTRGGLVWGEAFDRDPDQLDGQLVARGELVATRVAVLRGRAMVARYADHHRVAAGCIARARDLDSTRSRLVLRPADPILGHLRVRVIKGLVALWPLVAAVVVLGPSWVAVVVAVAAVDLAAARLYRHRLRTRRFDRLLAAGHFRRPVAIQCQRQHPPARQQRGGTGHGESDEHDLQAIPRGG